MEIITLETKRYRRCCSLCPNSDSPSDRLAPFPSRHDLDRALFHDAGELVV